MSATGKPFCSQPWSTLYVQWDGKVTRPCIRGPQNMGSLESVEDIYTLWNGPSLQTVRESVAKRAGLNNACRTCSASPSRTIDHFGGFGQNIGGDFGYEKLENYYDAIDAYEQANPNPTTGPIVLVLDMSSKCHIRCQKCFVYHSDMQYSLGHMSEEVFDKVRPLLRTALEVIGHENGECMLNKRFVEMVTEIKSNGCRFMFNTTGQLITEEKAKLLVELGVDKIMLSIDATDAETYEKLHKGGAYDKVMNGIAAINREKARRGTDLPRLGWYFVAHQSNIDQLPTAARMAVELGFGMMFVTQLNRPTGEQWRSYFDFYRQEGLSRSDDGVSKFKSGLAQAKLIAESAGLEFFSGSPDA